AGARVVGRFPDGVWLADLAGLASPGLVAVQVMEALGVRQEAGVPVLEALGYRLHSADLLLGLDNCEHLRDACAGLAGGGVGGWPVRCWGARGGCEYWRPAANLWGCRERSRTRCRRWRCRRSRRICRTPPGRRRCGCFRTAPRRRAAPPLRGWRRWRWPGGSA